MEPLHLRFIDPPNRRPPPYNEGTSTMDETMGAWLRHRGSYDARGVMEVIDNPKLGIPGHAAPPNPRGVHLYMTRDPNPNVYCSNNTHTWFTPQADWTFPSVETRHYNLPYTVAKGFVYN